MKISLQLTIKNMMAIFVMMFGLSMSTIQANPMGIPQIPQIPAFLPMMMDVPMTEKLPIDGEWMINDIRKRIRIEGGRAYAVDSWLHLFVLKVEPMMVVSQEWRRTGPGQYSGQDLPLVGPFTATLMPNGSMSVRVQGMFGPVNLTFSPIRLDDRRRFDREKAGGNEDSEDSYPEEDEYIEEDDDQYIEDDDQYIEDDEQYVEDEEEIIDDDDGFSDGGFEEGGFEEEEFEEEFFEEEEVADVEALSYSRYSCKGKGLYYSKVNGVKACYTCPDGMKRASATRKMNHPKACVNRKGKNTYAKGLKLANLKKCKKGQFKHKGYCKACPEGTKRKHIAGIDSGYCKVLD